MCGGRAYLLEKVGVYSDADDWADYLEELKDNADEEVYKGMEPENLSLKGIPPCWDRDAYLQIMKVLCECEDGVMSWKDFVALPFCSTKIARALICYNLLHCRSKSRLAGDLRWYKGSWPVVMPISRVHLNAMKDLVACWSG
ncbi:hypothetical protein GOP47_0007671 [Adiantum capillus-veneris]|uniref:Uncharacterized protein n=1 Tax=Adiantum capillus-veneris TaxID=13818 RepID=A0A9D4V2M5_ADICA|nr:hypothetical protein GOP47_0007671 [Adiantum capillus-veneris]